MPGATMPEAAVYKYRNVKFRKNEVRSYLKPIRYVPLTFGLYFEYLMPPPACKLVAPEQCHEGQLGFFVHSTPDA
jgi:hypothetical protein